MKNVATENENKALYICTIDKLIVNINMISILIISLYTEYNCDDLLQNSSHKTSSCMLSVSDSTSCEAVLLGAVSYYNT